MVWQRDNLSLYYAILLLFLLASFNSYSFIRISNLIINNNNNITSNYTTSCNTPTVKDKHKSKYTMSTNNKSAASPVLLLVLLSGLFYFL